MDPAVQRAIAERIITAVGGTNNFKCSLCPATFCGNVPVKQHLSGREHANNGAAYILANPSDKRQSLRKLVSPRLLAAAERQEVRGMRCRICGLDFNGAAPLEQHVAGSDHAKKRLASGIPQGAVAGARAGVQHLQPHISPLAAHYDGNGPIECGLCKVQCTGKQSYDEHVKGDKHRKKALALGLQIGASVDITPKKVARLVTQDDGNGPIMCSLCKVQCTSRQSYEEHIRGDKHRKKATTAFELPVTSKKPSVQATTAFELPVTSKKPSVQATPAFEVPVAFKKPSVQATPAFEVPVAFKKPSVQVTSAATRKTYRVESVPRGFVYIFNNKFTGQEDERVGAELDSVNLKGTFTALGYAVFLRENFKAQQIKDELDSIRADRKLNDVDALIFFFLSHGNSPYSFRGNDNKDLDLRGLRRKFADSKCPQMKGKPKVFFANYCRGDRFQKRIEFDGAHEYDDGSVEAPRDMVTIQAAIEGVKVLRSEGLGTYFVKCLCDILQHHGRSKSLKDVYHELDVRTQEMGGTQPMWEDYVFHEFFF